MFLATLGALAALAQANPREDGHQAYLFAYPLVLMDATQGARGGPDPNAFLHAPAFPDATFRRVVRPNADTLYSSAWLDLSKGPVMMKLPEMNGRYYLMQVLDAWTETIANPGKRTTGTGEGWFAIAGPGFKGKLPAGAQRIDSETNMVWLLGRIQTNGPADYANVHAMQRGFRIMPLSRFPDGGGRGAATEGAQRTPPPELVEKMSNLAFFNRFLQLLEANPAHRADAPFMRKLAELGLKPGQNLTALPGAAFEEGVEVAKKLLASAEQLRATVVGQAGWSRPRQNVGRYGVDYLARAVVARTGLGANPPEDAVYLSCYKDSAGKPLEGAKTYRLHFEKSLLPPVEAFWSITAYNGAGYFISNPAGRYAIGDRDPLQYNADGSLDIFIQSQAPADAEKKANWLPAPASGAFMLSFRLYWPRNEVLVGKWSPPPLLP